MRNHQNRSIDCQNQRRAERNGKTDMAMRQTSYFDEIMAEMRPSESNHKGQP